MSGRTYGSLGKMVEQEKSRKDKKTEIGKWQNEWKKKGPVWFAENVLTCPPNVPSHPIFDANNNPEIWCEGCQREHRKFRENGTPHHIILADYQKEFLMDLWQNKSSLTLVVAARGAGKTFVLAIWYCWLLATHNRYSITYMGGSSKQSKLCQEYIDDWRDDDSRIKKIIHKSLRGIDRYCLTKDKSHIAFSACSPTSARGPHVNEVCLDEVCTAEDKSEEGSKAVKAAMWQITGKRVSRLVMASTAHYVHGMFYEYMTNHKKYGFKVYQWAIAKHISGKKPLETYTDKEGNNWLPNVWWLTRKEIGDLRKTKSDEEWLCEALGGASMASGAVFKKKDLDVCICSLCDECEPYDWEKCKLCKLLKLGTVEDSTKYIIERRGGFDYGVSEAPCALSVFGRKGDTVFVLFNDEQLGLREEEKIDWIHTNMQKQKTWTFIPDPAVAGKHLNERMEEKGYAVYIIPEAEKTERIYNIINFVEKHKMVIPKAFWYLTQSLRKACWKKGKIRKVDDHSLDTCQYGMVDYQIEEGGNILDEFLATLPKDRKKRKELSIEELYGIKWDKV